MEQIPTEVMEKIEQFIRSGKVYLNYHDSFKQGYLLALASPCALCESVDSFLLQIAKEKNLYVDFSDKSYDGDKEAPMDRIGLIEYLNKSCEGKEKEIAELKAENERLKGLMRKAWKYGGYDCECETCQTIWQQFKTENGL